MTKPLRPRAQADRDVESTILHYRGEAGPGVASDFTAALTAAYEAIATRPATGSPRYGELLALSGLRHWPLKRFPYLVFYIEHAEHVEIWRVLHARRDVGAAMQEDSG